MVNVEPSNFKKVISNYKSAPKQNVVATSATAIIHSSSNHLVMDAKATLNKINITSNEKNLVTRNYSDETKALMKHIRDIAKELNLPDFYTGKIFDTINKKKTNVNVEHLIPHSYIIEESSHGFDVNSLINLVPISTKTNSKRGSIPLKEWYRQNPGYLKNSKNALLEYEKVDTPLINGKEWVKGLKETLNRTLGYNSFK